MVWNNWMKEPMRVAILFEEVYEVLGLLVFGRLRGGLKQKVDLPSDVCERRGVSISIPVEG